jgi:hypothetical protein
MKATTTHAVRNKQINTKGTTLMETDEKVQSDKKDESADSPVSATVTETPSAEELPKLSLTDAIRATLTDRMIASFEAFEAQVVKAEEKANLPTPIADATKVMKRFIDHKPDDAGIKAIFDAIGDAKAQREAASTIARFEKLYALLAEHAEVVDRDEGNKTAQTLRNMAESNMLEDVAIPLIENLTARWAAATPRGGSGQGAREWADLAFRLNVKCGVCGANLGTTTDNLNSHRDRVVNHMRDNHKTEISPKKGAKPETFNKLTEALNRVGMSQGTPGKPSFRKGGNETRVDTGDFLVTREGAA